VYTPRVKSPEVKTQKTMLKNIKGKDGKSPSPIDYDHVNLILEE